MKNCTISTFNNNDKSEKMRFGITTPQAKGIKIEKVSTWVSSPGNIDSTYVDHHSEFKKFPMCDYLDIDFGANVLSCHTYAPGPPTSSSRPKISNL